MKSYKIMAAVVLAGVFSTSAMAAELITKEVAQEKGLVSLGTITTSNEYTAPMDARVISLPPSARASVAAFAGHRPPAGG